jgi:HD-GYP domain-containing protein (c-di-GMP phosphodiesterase class II)
MAGQVEVDIHSLIIGRKLSFPIRDVNGVLLLAAGSTITRDLKMRIIERGISRLMLDESDADTATLRRETTGIPVDPGGELNEKVALKLESLIRSGAMIVRNIGPSVRNSVVPHGATTYDRERHSALVNRHKESAEAVDGMIDEAVQGGEVDGTQMSQVTDSYIQSLTDDIANTLSVSLIKDQDPTLAQHSLNVSILAMATAIEMGFDKKNVALIGIAGLVQDIGMAFVPKHLRDADHALNEIEFLEVQKHPIRTANILERMRTIPNVVTLVAYQSHERPDGSGYPRGRDKKSIHAFARILLVADSYTAMTTPRPHRPAMIPYAAMENLIRQARDWRVDRPVVRNLLHVIGLFPIGSYVALSDGSVGKVIRSSGEDFTRPIVQRVQDRAGAAIDPDDDSTVVDLKSSHVKVVQALPTPGSKETGLSLQSAALTA